MPTYEYECTKCGKQWERFQSIKAEPERECPKCGRNTARRKVGIGFAILSGGRSGDGGDGGGASAGGKGSSDAGSAAAKSPTTGAGEAKAASGDAAPRSGKDAPAAAAPKDDGKLNSTHPARDGRGAGNLRDAIARQRAAKGAESPRGAAKSAKKGPARGPARGKR